MYPDRSASAFIDVCERYQARPVSALEPGAEGGRASLFFALRSFLKIIACNPLHAAWLITRRGNFGSRPSPLGIFRRRSGYVVRTKSPNSSIRALVGMLPLVCFLAGCAPELSYRYRLTVEVDTPQGPRHGSSVIENTWTDYREAKWATRESQLLTTRVRGDAPVVELGDGRLLVALLAQGPLANDDPDFSEIVPTTLGISWMSKIQTHRDAVEGARAQPGPRTVPAEVLPPFATFTDPANAKSARLVPPDRLETAFGPGYRLRAVTLEITDDPVTRSITKWLPWVTATLGYLDGDFSCNTSIRACLHGGHFRRD